MQRDGPDLLSYFERRVEPRADAADLLADVFLIAWRRADAMPDDEREARMWLFGLARNVLANYRRGQRRSSGLATRLRAEVQRSTRLEQAQSAGEVSEALERLPEQLAELVKLVHWDGFGVGDAGALLGMTASTARSRYARARQLLVLELNTYADADDVEDGSEVPIRARQGHATRPPQPRPLNG